jgi:hypothetical protein
VGVIGLGAGTLAAYGAPGDVFRFYEINPQVIQIAQTYFSFLSQSRARIEVVPGDARLSLESEAPQNDDILVVDAFSGDAIPVHLLTQEAFRLYFSHLKPDGILAVHTSNRFLDLAPVVQKLADSFGYKVLCLVNDPDPDHLIEATQWMLVTRNQTFLDQPQLKAHEIPLEVPTDFPLWTDDYNSLFSVFKKQTSQ